LQVLITGLRIGDVYALRSVALALIFGIMKVGSTLPRATA
jgi:branched-subunit amino acid ABC-type transport system permease component